ncbi:ribonuclease T2 [Mesorhizobium sp. J18]|uniref:ribonuclease T2 family protein n=1 Tax=Mesorhizobium sp. J18 TaxID=935263 RepID=UPI00119C7638|nr:ribonuclease [Mesorhizobium sp. J18]TWG93770.1 ribonuclease T2 [Mesorhizobium sp. J18]
MRILRWPPFKAALFLCFHGFAVSGAATAAEAAEFDFYALALTWSPSYCAVEGENANRRQCGDDSSFGFIVHGLWPQEEGGGYPEFCAGSGPDRVPDKLVRQYLDIMPSAGLIGHQWRKHGSCTGLGQEGYLRTVRAARERVRIPEAFRQSEDARMVDPDVLEKAFLDANPGLEAIGIAVTCDQRYLREVRICMTKDLQFRPCPEIDEDQCRMDEALMPPGGG